MIGNLRRLYGRSSKGTSNRTSVRLTITPETMQALKKNMDYGPGKNGSAFFEVAARLLLVLIDPDAGLEAMASELQQVFDGPSLARKMRILAKYLEA